MSAREVFEKVAAAGESQLRAAYKGMPDAVFEARLNEKTMTPKEMAGHMQEACAALQKAMRGEEHEWGSFQPPAGSGEQAVAALMAERAKAVAAVLASPEPGKLAEGLDYLTVHEAYHIGQIAALRLAHEPDWDAYSLYAH